MNKNNCFSMFPVSVVSSLSASLIQKLTQLLQNALTQEDYSLFSKDSLVSEDDGHFVVIHNSVETEVNMFVVDQDLLNPFFEGNPFAMLCFFNLMNYMSKVSGYKIENVGLPFAKAIESVNSYNYCKITDISNMLCCLHNLIVSSGLRSTTDGLVNDFADSCVAGVLIYVCQFLEILFNKEASDDEIFEVVSEFPVSRGDQDSVIIAISRVIILSLLRRISLECKVLNLKSDSLDKVIKASSFVHKLSSSGKVDLGEGPKILVNPLDSVKSQGGLNHGDFNNLEITIDKYNDNQRSFEEDELLEDDFFSGEKVQDVFSQNAKLMTNLNNRDEAGLVNQKIIVANEGLKTSGHTVVYREAPIEYTRNSLPPVKTVVITPTNSNQISVKPQIQLNIKPRNQVGVGSIKTTGAITRSVDQSVGKVSLESRAVSLGLSVNNGQSLDIKKIQSEGTNYKVSKKRI